MAFLLDTSTNHYIPLAPHHTFGRLKNSVDTLLNKPYISKLHTTIEWRGNNWFIKNLGRNGTHVNGSRLPSHQSKELNEGDHIHFAELTDPPFIVQDLSPPSDVLWPINPQGKPQPIVLDRYHILPNEEAPRISLHKDNHQWFIEPIDPNGEQAVTALQSGDTITCEQRAWQLLQVDVYGPTEAKSLFSQELNEFTFHFELSQDEEITQLTLSQGEHTIDLGVRTHHYLLVQLARHRLRHCEQGVAECEQGWLYTEQIVKELGLDETHLNIQIYRVRKQISDALPHVNIQRDLIHRQSGKLRFGCTKFMISKSGQLTNQSPLSRSSREQDIKALTI